MIGKMPKLIIIAGPNGSGKSTLTKSYQAHGLISFPVVNPDEIAKNLIRNTSGKSESRQASRLWRKGRSILTGIRASQLRQH